MWCRIVLESEVNYYCEKCAITFWCMFVPVCASKDDGLILVNNQRMILHPGLHVQTNPCDLHKTILHINNYGHVMTLDCDYLTAEANHHRSQIWSLILWTCLNVVLPNIMHLLCILCHAVNKLFYVNSQCTCMFYSAHQTCAKVVNKVNITVFNHPK